MNNFSSLINRYNLVKQIPIFSKLTWYDLQRIARKAVVENHHKGDIIRREGDPPDFFYCLISGRLQAYTSSNKGKKDRVEFIHRGTHFGIISLLTGENHSMNYEAVNDSVILKISKEDFHSILKGIPDLGVELSQSLSKRVRNQFRGEKTIFESTIISICSPQRDTGTSTYAANLALSLEKETHKKVVLVQCHSESSEPVSSETSGENGRPEWKMDLVALSEITSDYQKVLDSIQTSGLRISVLNLYLDTDQIEVKAQISYFISALVGEYHYVVMDLPNVLTLNAVEVLNQSDKVHILSSDDTDSLKETRSVIDRLEVNLKEYFREDNIKVIIRPRHNKVYLSFEDINKEIDYHVYTAFPYFKAEDLKIKIESATLKMRRCDERHEYTKQVTRIAREIGGVRVGLVLGGGAALGIAHVGVIRVLEEHNIPVDIVVGSSMGALIGSLWTIGNNSKELEVIAREFEKKTNMLKLFDPPLIPISCLIKGGLIKRWLRKHLGNRTFYGVNIPFKVVAYDLTRREEQVIQSGSLVDAVRKSIAIPGVIKAVQEEDKLIIDGGVLNPLPTNVLASLGIKKIIAVNVLQSPEDIATGVDIDNEKSKIKMDVKFMKAPFGFVWLRVIRFLKGLFTPNISDIIVRTLQASEYVISEQSANQADVLIHPELVGVNWYELNKVDELIHAGETATRHALPEIQKLIEE